jgi:hypothetical protein
MVLNCMKKSVFILLFLLCFSAKSQNLEAIYGIAFNQNPTESKEAKISAEIKIFSQKMLNGADFLFIICSFSA